LPFARLDQCNLLNSFELMSLAGFRILLGAVLLSATVPAVAQAQIYASRDSAGNLVLSDKPINPTGIIKTYPVPNATGVRATRGIVSERAAQYDELIEENATAHGVSPHLVRAVIQQESGFNARATSHKGAMGLMQLMPATAAELGVSDPYNPSENIRGGVAYLKGLLVKFQQNVELALAAYNAGPTAVTRYGAIPPYRETQNYVTRITKAVDAIPKGKNIYKTTEIVNGREITRLSTVETPGAVLVRTAKQ
jgi:soluble lytic murein transglycosylase-like protein